MTPGQGSQTAGFLSAWVSVAKNKELLYRFSSISKMDLEFFGTKASQQEITDTSIAQPLLTSLAFISANNLNFYEHKNIIFTGHSVGEFSAASLAGFYSQDVAIELVTIRGQAMAHAAKNSDATGMSAVLGGQKSEVMKYIESFDLVSANVNSNGQIVASGLIKDLEKLAAEPMESTKVRKLEVAGAFHSKYMKTAEVELTKVFENIEITKPNYRFVSNKDGSIISDPDLLKQSLISQITSPVRWDLCQAKLIIHGVTGMLELAPGGVLTGIAKREIPGVELFAIKSPDDIPQAQDFIDKHARIQG